MRLHTRVLAACWLFAFAAASRAADPGPDIHDTRMLSEPAISRTQIAFIYAGDLWTSDLDGKNVRRLTSDVGLESNPAFSPDGKWIAFSAQYEGNTDVYVVSAEGGVPRRLTWHPGADIVQGFTPDGKSVLFTSPRAVYTGRYTQLFTVPVEGRRRAAAPDSQRRPRASTRPTASGSPTTRCSPQFLQWKRYRGGAVSQVWIYDVATHAVEKMPQPAGPRERRGPDVDRRHRVLPLGPRRRVQPLRLRHEVEGDPRV